MVDTLLCTMLPLHGLHQLASNYFLQINENGTKETKCTSEQYILEAFSTKTKMHRSMIMLGEDCMVRTSLLFQACLSVAMLKRPIIYITKNQFNQLPHSVLHMPQAENDLLVLINFKYLQSHDEVVDYLCHIHLDTVLPALIVIDNLQSYVDLTDNEQDVDKTRQYAIICAHLSYAVANINIKSICASIVASAPLENNQFLHFYFDSFCHLKPLVKNSVYEVTCKSSESSSVESTASLCVKQSIIHLKEFVVAEKQLSVTDTDTLSEKT